MPTHIHSQLVHCCLSDCPIPENDAHASHSNALHPSDSDNVLSPVALSALRVTCQNGIRACAGRIVGSQPSSSDF